jgi:hypothetical protein
MTKSSGKFFNLEKSAIDDKSGNGVEAPVIRPLGSADGQGRGSLFGSGRKGSIHTHKLSESIFKRCQSGDLTKLMRQSSGVVKRSDFSRGHDAEPGSPGHNDEATLGG